MHILGLHVEPVEDLVIMLPHIDVGGKGPTRTARLRPVLQMAALVNLCVPLQPPNRQAATWILETAGLHIRIKP